jgi:hypothetical protein
MCAKGSPQPVGVFGLPLGFLPLWSWDFAFDREGNAIGAWHPKAGGVASYLSAYERHVFGMDDERPNKLTFRAWQV